jgi:membrane fusion protein (multidrug efflux system)
MKINQLFISLTLVLLSVFLFLGCSNEKKEGKMMPGKGMNAPQLVKYIVLKDTSISETIQITGTVQADEEIDLRAEMSGKVIKILFTEGTKVQQGDLLIKINDDELKAQKDRAEARLKLATEQEYRQRTLLKKEAISQQEYDLVFTELQSMKAELALLKAQLAKTEIRAPFNGSIGLRMISNGDYITPNTNIAKLVKDDKVKITFSIPEKYASFINKNAEIVFNVDANSKNYKAKVYALDPSIDENTRTLNIRAMADNDGTLKSGSFCKVSLTLNEIKNTILVPNETLIPILKGKKVYLSKNKQAAEVIVKTGIRTDQYVQITDGLKAGDTLITSGIMSIKNGSPLNIK